jgi:lambda repressor-like predicted transcriptional regulator
MDDLVFTALAIKPLIWPSWYAHPKRKTSTRRPAERR